MNEFIVEPVKYRKGYCATKCATMRSAENECGRLMAQTGFEWHIIIRRVK